MYAKRVGGPRAGVTLVELVIALFLGSIAFLGLGYIFGLNYGLWMRGQSRMVLHAGAARALEEIVRTAGYASDFSLSGEGELRVFMPRSPIADSSSSQAESETVFRLSGNRLFRDGKLLVPHAGDSTLGVAAFEPSIVFAEGTGVRTLRVGLSLYTRSGNSAPAETLHFETAAHARNAGLGLAGSP